MVRYTPVTSSAALIAFEVRAHGSSGVARYVGQGERRALATSLSLGQGEGPLHGLVLLSTEDFPAVKVTFLETFGRVKCHLPSFLAIYSSAIVWPGSLSRKTT